MAGTMQTGGYVIQGTSAFFEDADLIRVGYGYPDENAVWLISTDGGFLDLSDELPLTVYSLNMIESYAAIDLTTGAGRDSLRGSQYADTLRAGAGNDVLYGMGPDSLYGGLGDDIFVMENASGVVEGGEGTDILINADLTTISVTGIEVLSGETRGTVAQLEAVDTFKAYNRGTGTVDPTGYVTIRIVGSGTLNLADELGFQAASVYSSSLGNTVTAGTSNDVIQGDMETGADRFYGGFGDDELWGIAGDDILDGGAGNDSLWGGIGHDTLLGQAGDDRLEGYDGNDTLNGGSGADRMAGGRGNDRYVVDNAGDVVWEDVWEDNGGTDLVAASVSFALADPIENLVLTGTAALNGTGNWLNNRLTGNAGANTLLGDEGDDVLDGGAGLDRLEGGGGNDTYVLATPGDTVVEAADFGTDTVRAGYSLALGANLENLQLTGLADLSGTGNALANRLTGNSGANLLKGQDGADTLLGLGGIDTLDGGAGNDRLQGGAGNDTYVIGSGSDRLVEAVSAGSDLVRSSISHTLLVNFEKLTLTGTANLNGSGNAAANTLTGNAGANVLKGLGGNDSLVGGGGADRLYGGTGSDTLDGGAGADSFYFARGDGRDMVKSFVNNADTIFVDDALWGGGAKTASQILAYGKVSNGDAVFDFRNGNVLTVDGVTDLRILADDLAWF